ncbi:uncharacterized protein FA14DRAFT_160560 [Meira miltonrushii]|uniref:Uncharacterized protein n=1 Tax=Meira miltonrushii TaxID=1280837 RepID=A0A316VHD4_9BASI|nr:uncharacterized protein FA14DRAFT_160560 [Meira miltonrushii]PWN35401.1 hypothetical protein FA14DRAFT_160560 [Meira miltonrushii]
MNEIQVLRNKFALNPHPFYIVLGLQECITSVCFGLALNVLLAQGYAFFNTNLNAR